MKIVYVTVSFPFGPGEAFLGPEIGGLVRAGHEVLVIPRSPRGNNVHGEGAAACAVREGLLSPGVLGTAVRVLAARPARVSAGAAPLVPGRGVSVRLRCWTKNCSILPKAVWLADIAKRWGAEHIHAHWAGTTATMAWVAGGIAGLPWSFTAHRWDIVENNLLEAKIAAAAFARFISNDGVDLARAAGIALNVNVRVIRMGVEIPPAVPLSAPSRAIVLCPANLTPIKGHRYLIQAWKLLSDQGVDGELWIAGPGELDRSLRAQVRELGLEESVCFLGAIPRERLLRMYATGSVSTVVLPSIDAANGWHEGVPVALVEAMSYGVPVVATSSGAIPELIAPGTGIIVPPRDPQALAAGIRMLTGDAGFARQIGAAGRRRAAEMHDIRRVISDLCAAFEASRRGRRRSQGFAADVLANPAR